MSKIYMGLALLVAAIVVVVLVMRDQQSAAAKAASADVGVAPLPSTLAVATQSTGIQSQPIAYPAVTPDGYFRNPLGLLT